MSDKKITICDVGLRDGLQGERLLLSAEQKIQLLGSLYDAGARYLEIGSFVRADIIPQMATTAELAAHAVEIADLKSNALIFNERGLEEAITSGVSGVCIVSIITDKLAEKNSRKSSSELHGVAKLLVQRARSAGLFVRIDVAPAWLCPFEGEVDSLLVLNRCGEYLESGADELALSDTIGHADPLRVGHLCAEFIRLFGAGRLAVHLHDTQGLGLANAYAALSEGVRIFDSSFGGLGGCPFAPGAAGNLATEDLLLLAEKLGYATGIDAQRLWSTVEFAELMLGVGLGGRTGAWWRRQFQQPDVSTRRENVCTH